MKAIQISEYQNTNGDLEIEVQFGGSFYRLDVCYSELPSIDFIQDDTAQVPIRLFKRNDLNDPVNVTREIVIPIAILDLVNVRYDQSLDDWGVSK